MTGFSTGVWEVPEGSYQIEAKSLNHRFIEVRVRLPGRYNLWEFKIIKLIKERQGQKKNLRPAQVKKKKSER